MIVPGDPRARSYRSDDRDLEGRDSELLVYQGGNGDWYLTIVPTGEKIGPTVRLTTSGQKLSGIPGAVARLWKALAPCECCPRGDEYNGFGSDGPLSFVCPQHCACHD